MRSPFPVIDAAALAAAQSLATGQSGADYRDSRNQPLVNTPAGVPGFFYRSGPGQRPDFGLGPQAKSQVTARRWSGCRRVQFG